MKASLRQQERSRAEQGLLINVPAVRKALLQIVITLEENFHDREDLLQEALVCFWSSARQHPEQRRSWYLQSVRFHLHHFRTSGRSLDSPKHRGAQVSFPDHCDEWDNWRDSLESDEGFLSAVAARDLFSLLVEGLTPKEQRILRGLFEGLRISEIADALHVPRGFVDRHRLRIAKLALKLGINPRGAGLGSGTILTGPNTQSHEAALSSSAQGALGFQGGFPHQGAHLDNAPACRRDGARHLCRVTVGKPTGQCFAPCRSDAEAA